MGEVMAASVQLVRLASVRTAATSAVNTNSSRRTSGGSALHGAGEAPTRNTSGGKDRESRGSYHQPAGDENVRIEVFAHAALGKEEAVFVASLSNSVLLVMRSGGGRQGINTGSSSLRSWLLDWPVQGKIRGLCVSPDLQCVLCVTQDLEGVYILAIDNLGVGVQEGREAAATDETNAAGDVIKDVSERGADDLAGSSVGSSGGTRPTVAATGRTARPTPRAAATAAFPSLLHLASRGQRRRAGPVAHTAAEPVFIASLARRGGGGGSRERQDDGGRRRSSGSGRSSPGGKERRSSRVNAEQLECLWWAARNGDHVAVIGRPDGEVHFLDLERLDTWVIKSPPPAVARGRVCALTINTLASPAADITSRGERSLRMENTGTGISACQFEHYDPPLHLVTVLETGAVFVVLLERGRPNYGGDAAIGGSDGDSDSVGGGGGKPGDVNSDGVSGESSDDGFGESDVVQHHRGSSSSIHILMKYARLGADRAEDADFAPAWLDVGRGGSGGGGGAMGVRAIQSLGGFPGNTHSASYAEAFRLRMSIITRAWGNKCAVKIVRLAAVPEAVGGDADVHRRERGSGRQQALRTETVRTVNLPADHPTPEQHALAAVDGSWVVLASPPAGGAPARVTIAPLNIAERPAPSSIRVFSLPPGENVIGVALLPASHASEASLVSQPVHKGEHGDANLSRGSWGLVWTNAGIYRADLGGEKKAETTPSDASRITLPKPPPKAPPPLPPVKSNTRATKPTHGTPTASIAIRRPSAAAVLRARELHASGHLEEASQVAMDALDGTRAASAGSGQAMHGREETWGGVTTRMVREDIANSLLEWLIALHLRRSPQDTQTVSEEHVAAPPGRATALTRSDYKPGSERASQPPARSLPRGSRREGKQASTARSSNKEPNEAAPAPTRVMSRLEKFILSSQDYDPLLATTLLHAHGEADLAVVAGTARGRVALSGVLRVLAESSWPPRLGARAVEALCTKGAAAEAVRVGGGTLLAAMDPRLQVRLLMADRRILFGAAGKQDESKLPSPGRDDMAVAAGAMDEPLTGVPGVIRSYLGPIIYALPDEALAGVACQLIRWCAMDAPAECRGDTVESLPNVDARPKILLSSPEREATDVVFDSLFELSGRQPPPGPEHHRAWLQSGCVGCTISGESVYKTESETMGASSSAFIASPISSTNPISSTSGGVDRHLSTSEFQGGRSEWARVVSSFRRIFAEEGLSDDDGRAGAELGRFSTARQVGGLPTAARKVLVRALPLLRGWYDPVRLLLKAKGAQCWAAVALELHSLEHRREAASAKLYGVVCLLQGGNMGEPGVLSRILCGEDLSRLRAAPQYGLPPVSADADATRDEENRTVGAAQVLRVIDDYALRHSSAAAGVRTAATGCSQPATEIALVADHSPCTPTAILERASILGEALCVWRRFELPLTSLEAALRLRLPEEDNALVLSALLFPQLSPDVRVATHRGSDTAGDAPSGVDTTRAGWSVAPDQAVSLGPTLAQIEAARGLGLSPPFNLALLQAGGRVAVEAASRRTPGLGSGGLALSVSATGVRPSHSAAASVYDLHNTMRSALASLLEHRQKAGSSESVWIGPAITTSRNSVKVLGRSSVRSFRGVTSSDGMEDSGGWLGRSGGDNPGGGEAVWFSCGHRFSRDDLLRTVVPACVSSLGHATSSLQRTQQLLVREYEGRSARAACPECAAKELRRLVSSLRPAAAAAAAAAATVAGGGGSAGNPASLTMPPSPPRQLSSLRTHDERMTVR